ncbi:uncharacterized protein LOC111348542 isoform X3 [Spodoptera litura]|uniref:Uncharacterized protein LOC111348542 isoform X3 n=1 Tax=Spodoptera litura TaxID=69820 RepID=A0A9J7II31_SPOLT|nr:uncharacterized protein LOC111348542 isoform X3 [Spodoptera litura]
MRTRDRLAELQHLASGAAGGVYCDTVQPSEPDAAAKHDAHIQDIFREVERMRGWIHDLDNNSQLIRRLHSDPTFHTNKNLQDQLDAAVTASNATGLKVSGALRQFEGRLSTRNDAAARIARLQYAACRRLYADALQRHHTALDAVRAQQLLLLQHQIQLKSVRRARGVLQPSCRCRRRSARRCWSPTTSRCSWTTCAPRPRRRSAHCATWRRATRSSRASRPRWSTCATSSRSSRTSSRNSKTRWTA